MPDENGGEGGNSGESSGGNSAAPDGERPFGEKTAASLEVLGQAIAMLNGRIDTAEAIASATADANIEAFRDVRERLDAQERRTSELEAALISLARTLGVSPVWSNEGEGFPPATH
jgi:hypothetical protein